MFHIRLERGFVSTNYIAAGVNKKFHPTLAHQPLFAVLGEVVDSVGVTFRHYGQTADLCRFPAARHSDAFIYGRSDVMALPLFDFYVGPVHLVYQRLSAVTWFHWIHGFSL